MSELTTLKAGMVCSGLVDSELVCTGRFVRGIDVFKLKSILLGRLQGASFLSQVLLLGSQAGGAPSVEAWYMGKYLFSSMFKAP